MTNRDISDVLKTIPEFEFNEPFLTDIQKFTAREDFLNSTFGKFAKYMKLYSELYYDNDKELLELIAEFVNYKYTGDHFASWPGATHPKLIDIMSNDFDTAIAQNNDNVLKLNTVYLAALLQSGLDSKRTVKRKVRLLKDIYNAGHLKIKGMLVKTTLTTIKKSVGLQLYSSLSVKFIISDKPSSSNERISRKAKSIIGNCNGIINVGDDGEVITSQGVFYISRYISYYRSIIKYVEANGTLFTHILSWLAPTALILILRFW